MVMEAFKNSADIQQVYGKLKTEDTLARHFGSQFSTTNITPGGPDVYIASINVSSNKASYGIIKGNLGTFEQVAPPVPPAPADGAVSLTDMASLITTKEDRIENTRLAKGFIRQKGHYIGETVDFVIGELTSLVMPEPTAAHVLANKEQSIEEQVNANKLILDSANAHQTKGQVMVMETARCMEDHHINMVCQLVMGTFTSTAEKISTRRPSF